MTRCFMHDYEYYGVSGNGITFYRCVKCNLHMPGYNLSDYDRYKANKKRDSK